MYMVRNKLLRASGLGLRAWSISGLFPKQPTLLGNTHLVSGYPKP